MRPLLPALLVLAAFASYARADDVSDILAKSKEKGKAVAEPASKPADPTPEQCGPLAHPTHRGTLCDNFDDCVALCTCACKWDKKKWDPKPKDDGSTTCTGLPQTGYGMLPPDAPELLAVSSYPYVAVADGLRATQIVLDGLRNLSDHLAASENRRTRRFTVRVESCYRPHLEDSVPECGYVMKSKYMLDKLGPNSDQRDYWLFTGNPQNEGLAWPGRTPHSGGYACDIVMLDERGNPCFDWRAGVDGAPVCLIPAQQASSMMDAEVTATGVDAKRLTYEAWHYEWGANSAGCIAPDCARNYWPIVGHPPQTR